jgi:hypothetical protein
MKKAPKNIYVELMKNNSIRMSLVEDVAEYPVKKQQRKLPIEQKDLLASYALLQTDMEGAAAIADAFNCKQPLPWPMREVEFNKNESYNPLKNFEDVVYNLNYYKNQITRIIQDYEDGFEVQQSAVV